MADNVAERISEAIEPLVGSVLAKVTVDVESMRLGKAPGELRLDDIPEISIAVERHLISFVGSELAQAAAARVREIHLV